VKENYFWPLVKPDWVAERRWKSGRTACRFASGPNDFTPDYARHKTDLILSADDADFADKKWKPLRQSVKSAAK
jgi:hypothetical protein